MSGNSEQPIDQPIHQRRFGGINRLYGDQALDVLQGKHVVVVGIGGVGSWAVEALARSGVGKLTLIDLDHVSESNLNRQIHAQESTLGMAKVQAMAERIAAYAPTCQVTLIDDFLEPENIDLLLNTGEGVHALVDACDQAKAKIAMAAWAKQNHVPLIMAGAAGGKTKPWMLNVDDLSKTTNDPLLAKVRQQLRKLHQFPGGGTERHKLKTLPAMGVAVVYSTETMVSQNVCDASAGLACAGYGSIVTVTGGMGFAMASWVIERLLR